MKKTSKFMQLIMAFIVFAMCVGCSVNPVRISEAEANIVSSEPVLEEPDYRPGSEIEWYNFLRDTETLDKQYDQRMYSAILNVSNGIVKQYSSVQRETDSDLLCYSAAKNYACYDYPQLEFLEYMTKFDHENDSFYLEVSNKSEYDQIIAEIDSAIKNLVDEVNKETSLVDKYRLIYDWIVSNVNYDFKRLELKKKRWRAETEEEIEYMENTNADNIYGAIVEKNAACLGISKAFKYICNKCQLDCMVTLGSVVDEEGKSRGHAWNVVPLYGNYFLIDCTWRLKSYVEYGDYQVVDKNTGCRTFTTIEKYDYFLLDDLWSSSRTLDDDSIDQFFRQEATNWTFDGNIAKCDNGLTIELPNDYKFVPGHGSYLCYQLTSEGVDKILKGEETDQIFLDFNAQIEQAIVMNEYKGRRVESIVDVNENCLNVEGRGVGTCYMVIVRYNDELYTIKLQHNSI